MVRPREFRDRNTQIIIQKADQPDAVVNFFDAYGLAGKDRAEIYFLAAHADAAATGDDNDLVVKRTIVLHLKGKLKGKAIGPAASVGQPLNAAFLVAIDLVAGLASNAELPAKFGLMPD